MQQLCGLLISLFAALACAQSSSGIVYPTTAASTASALPSASGYSYAGCYNETTGIAGAGGARAITGGKDSANNTMTINTCLAFCASGDAGGTKMQFAGLEYGRECYCGPYLSSLTMPLNASRCNYACNGNASEVCGGSLAITLYNLTSAASPGRAWGALPGSAVWYGSAAAVAGLVAAVL